MISQTKLNPPCLLPPQIRSVFHCAVESLVRHNATGPHAARLVYLLRNLGANINRQDQVSVFHIMYGKPLVQ